MKPGVCACGIETVTFMITVFPSTLGPTPFHASLLSFENTCISFPQSHCWTGIFDTIFHILFYTGIINPVNHSWTFHKIPYPNRQMCDTQSGSTILQLKSEIKTSLPIPLVYTNSFMVDCEIYISYCRRLIPDGIHRPCESFYTTYENTGHKPL